MLENSGGAVSGPRAVEFGLSVVRGPGRSGITCHQRGAVERISRGLSGCGYELLDENIIGTQLTRDGGYVAMTELLDRDVEVQAVFAVNDVMAVGAMAALREQGHQVPQDMALVRFYDIATLRDVQPPLTTVRLPLVQIGRRALELALDQLDGQPAVAVTVVGEVVVRAAWRQLTAVAAPVSTGSIQEGQSIHLGAGTRISFMTAYEVTQDLLAATASSPSADTTAQARTNGATEHCFSSSSSGVGWKRTSGPQSISTTSQPSAVRMLR